MPLSTLVIGNPASSAGNAARMLKRVLGLMRRTLGDFELEWTQEPRDAERIAREATRAGVSRLIVAGGDGTANEVVTGLLSAGVDRGVEVGFLPLGSGRDLCRSLELPGGLENAIACIATGYTRFIDAGRVSAKNFSGSDKIRNFVNISSAGLSAEIAGLTKPVSKRFRGKAAFLMDSLRGIARFRASNVALCLDGTLIYRGPLCFVAIANGSYFGGGMRVAPAADLGDGIFDIVVIPAFSKARLLWELPKIYQGSHVSIPSVLTRRGRCLEAKVVADLDVPVEVDGECLGILPARFELLPRALRVFSPLP